MRTALPLIIHHNYSVQHDPDIYSLRAVFFARLFLFFFITIQHSRDGIYFYSYYLHSKNMLRKDMC